jgi:hypothetical protein
MDSRTWHTEYEPTYRRLIDLERKLSDIRCNWGQGNTQPGRLQEQLTDFQQQIDQLAAKL